MEKRKRRKKGSAKSKSRFYSRLKKLFDNEIKIEIKKVKEDYFYDEKRLFVKRAKTVKKLLSELKKFEVQILQEFSEELNWIRKQKYPLKWMSRDKRIRKALETRPLTVEVLNFIYNYHQEVSWEKQLKMHALYLKIKEREGLESQYKNKYNYTMFQTDSEFYQKARKSLNCSERYLKLYIQVFYETEIIKRLGKAGRFGYLYADGYWHEWKEVKRKIPFLKKSPDFIEALRTLPKRLKKCN
jgi:hypothetical protein